MKSVELIHQKGATKCFVLLQGQREQTYELFLPKQTFKLKHNKKVKPVVIHLKSNLQETLPPQYIDDDLMQLDEKNEDTDELIWYQSKIALQGFQIKSSEMFGLEHSDSL